MPDFKRQRLSRQTTQGGLPASGIGAALFGMPFFLAGLAILLIGLKVIPVDPSSVHAPYWLVTLSGFIFLAPGAYFILHGLRGVAAARRREEMRFRRQDAPWLADYPWQREGIRDHGSNRWRKVLIGIAFVAVFLVPFHYFIFNEEDDEVRIFRIALICADVAILCYAAWGVYLLLRHLKYGKSRLLFDRFPYHPGETLDVRFDNPGGLGAYDRLTMKLRFIEERVETHGRGRNRKTSLVLYQLYTDEQVIDQPGRIAPAEPAMPIHFPLPDDPELTNRLCEHPPRYWELEIKAETPGIDFDALFLVPVYAKQSS
jgi:hypothetical protein